MKEKIINFICKKLVFATIKNVKPNKTKTIVTEKYLVHITNDIDNWSVRIDITI